MEVVYRTIDGMIFRSPDDACMHEHRLGASLKMWNLNGDETTKPAEAVVVFLGNRKGVEIFLDASAREDASTQGITVDDRGMFFWNEDLQSFVWIAMGNALVYYKALTWFSENVTGMDYYDI